MADYTIKIENSAYNPASLSIKSGDRIIWENNDGMAHTATRMADPAFDTGLIRPGNKSAPITISSRAGTLEYTCRPHPFMGGKIVVT